MPLVMAGNPNNVTDGPSNITLSNNEISYNNTCNWEAVSPNPVPLNLQAPNCAGAGENDGCGCSGGGKFWEYDGATVTNNYVHDNDMIGLWVDTDNGGFTVSGNTFSHNWSVGYMEEISYNFSIMTMCSSTTLGALVRPIRAFRLARSTSPSLEAILEWPAR